MKSKSYFVSVIVNLCLVLIFSLGNAKAQISRNADDLRFYYYPTANDGIEIVFNDEASLSASNLKAATATIIVIDGFTSNLTSPMAQSVKNAYLENGGDNLNVIVLDWGRLSGSGPEQSLTFPSDITATYRIAIQNVAVVGQRVAEFLNFLRANKQIQFSDITIVGYSLGAHVAGSTGKAVKSSYGGLLSRITGLDPAGPLYLVQLNGRLRLDSNDASFVDIYHTNRGVLGVLWDVGQVNIYVNGGASQPECNIKDILGIIDLVIPIYSAQSYCSHSYAWKFFISAFETSYTACPCGGSNCTCLNCNDNCNNGIHVGPNIPYSASGTFSVSSGSLP